MKGHPENHYRIFQAMQGVPSGVRRLAAPSAEIGQVLRIHSSGYLEWLRSVAAESGQIRMIDPDTYVTRHSYQVALDAAGAAIRAAEMALEGKDCFAFVRPPGHHAESSRAMGFCLLNNIGIAAAQALEEADRVAIVDWDLHHGNGTQHAFYSHGRVMYCSVHDRFAFPCTGHAMETGEGAGKGLIINAPLIPGSAGPDFIAVFAEVFAPALLRFDPDLLLVSAGQDALKDDPLSSMRLRAPDYGALMGILLDTLDLPVALILEGGYGPSHGDAVGCIFRALMERKRSDVRDRSVNESTSEVISLLKEVHHLD
ncbi:MAG: histone deacetylase [Methanomicrobiales archaeon]|nr:histone deacetylase [Methanomicrobiales archaeon]